MELSSVFVRAVASLIWGSLGLYLMLPRGQASGKLGSRIVGGLLLIVSMILLATMSASGDAGVRFIYAYGDLGWNASYWFLAGLSLVSAVLMVTSRNPVYSALWFAMVLMSNSGLYLLMDASFLAAATVIVYAGAVVVTFLFVVMLAQPNGGLVIGVVLLTTLTFSAGTEIEAAAGTGSRRPSVADVARVASATTLPTKIDPARGHVEGLGRSLFLEHYMSVEVVGVLLLAAVVGALLIATHRVERTAKNAT